MKRLILIGMVVVLLIGAGCIGEDKTSYEASPVEMDNAVQDKYNYSIATSESIELNRTVNLTDEGGKTFSLSNWILTYEATEKMNVNDQEASLPKMIGVVSTPSITILGTEMNPLQKASIGELLSKAEGADNSSLIDEGKSGSSFAIEEKVGNISTEHQSTSKDITINKYNSTLTLEDGETVDAKVMFSQFKINDSIILVVGVYPEVIDREDEMVTVIENITLSDSPPQTTE